MNTCSVCKTREANHVRPVLCQKCWDERYRMTGKCPKCGNPMLKTAKLCHTCNLQSRRKDHTVLCEHCGKPFDNSGHPTVRFCSIRCGILHRLRPDPVAAFWRRVEKKGPKDCWEWQGSRDRVGYGTVRFRGRNQRTHRVAYTLAVGPIPKDKILLHSCDNPPCCNPAHLSVGTHLDNSRDKYAKGRGNNVKGERSGRALLTNQQVIQVRELVRGGATRAEVAKRFGVSKWVIDAIISRRTWTHLP